jgi:membrane protease YdiL (CAAX protease family)
MKFWKILSQFLVIFAIGFVVFVNYLYPYLEKIIPIEYDFRLGLYYLAVISYLCILVWVWVERKNLEEFHIDRFSFAILIIFGFYRGTLGVEGEVYFRAIVWSISVLLLFVYITNFNKIPKVNPTWTLIGFLSILLVIPIAYLFRFLDIPIVESFIVPTNGFIWNATRNILYNIIYVSTSEEFLTRGILWGQLRRWNIPENKVLWIQGIIFWLLHFQQFLTNPIQFFTILPLGIAISSLFVYYSKRLFPSIIFHTACNALIVLVVKMYL